MLLLTRQALRASCRYHRTPRRHISVLENDAQRDKLRQCVRFHGTGAAISRALPHRQRRGLTGGRLV